MEGLDRLLRPRSVAVIGASADPAKMTGRPVGYLQKHGFTGRLYPVNPRSAEIAGLRCYPDVASLPEAPDVALILLATERVQECVAALAARGAGAAIVLAGGYRETGGAGARRQEALREAAGPMRLLGPNTIGLANRTDGIMLSASGALEVAEMPAGAISVVSQSGGILGALLSRAADRGIGLAKLVATGNEADIDSTEILAHLLEDEATRVIALYLEGLRRPDAFRVAAARARARGKALVVYKVGRSEAGARSAVSHTGALAGSDRAYDALFRQCGTIRARSFADLLDIPAALVTGRQARGRRVAVVTSTGGAGTLLADICGSAGFDLPQPAAETACALAVALQDDGVPPGNPLDVTLAGLRPDTLRGAIDALLASPQYDAVVAVAGSSALSNPTLLADAARSCLGRSDKPLLAYVSPHAPGVLRALNGSGIPAFAAPESIGAVLEALQPPCHLAPPDKTAELPALPQDLRAGPLDEAESKALFARFGIPAVAEQIARDAETARAAATRLGPGPVVLKILSRHTAHKSELGGVRVSITAQDIPAACAEMRESLRRAGAPEPDGFLVQELVRDGIEIILGLRRDPQLGPVLLLGMGGVTAELIEDVSVRLLPITRDDAEQMVAELRTTRLLTGFRGAPPRDRAALLDAVMAFAGMAAAFGDRLVEAEINPLLVLPEGRGVRAVDGLAVLR